jgi:hypothetical protein
MEPKLDRVPEVPDAPSEDPLPIFFPPEEIKARGVHQRKGSTVGVVPIHLTRQCVVSTEGESRSTASGLLDMAGFPWLGMQKYM